MFRWAEWIESHADRLEYERHNGQLGTRKQSLGESDRDISCAGLAAELAACIIVSPWHVTDWMKKEERNEGNRGCDFPASWFQNGRAVEIKYTSIANGHMFVRPPRNTPGDMAAKYVDDSIYILMTGQPYTFDAVGWAGRSDLLKRGRLNPIPVKGKQRECWGIRADRLNPMDSLFDVLYRKQTRRESSLPVYASRT
ncbi:MAG TPA: hypothetical protein VHD56_13170 [Tepidisphaeraceae bacterium]|nr:hypothetical protein [Tepidisphaeraceae bacterium]